MVSFTYEKVGDPEGMRSLARIWMAKAGEIDGLGGRIGGAIGNMGFEGPAATGIAGRADAAQVQFTGAASQLRELASRMLGDADRVEQLNEEAKEKARKAAEAAEAERQRAAAEAAKEAESPQAAGAPTGAATSPPVPDAPGAPAAAPALGGVIAEGPA